MENNINPFSLMGESSPVVIKDFKLPIEEVSDNPFKKLVNQVPVLDANKELEKLRAAEKPRMEAITVSTYGVQDYLKKGYQLTDLDLSNPNLEQDLSSTQGRGERFLNNLKVAGANFASMAVGTFLTDPTDIVRFDSSSITEPSITSNIYDWSKGIAEDNRNFETRADMSDGVWDNITNWLNPMANSTKGVGKILESAAFGLGAAAGIGAQELLITALTGGVGTAPAIANQIQKLLNSEKYLEKALKISRIAEEGALNLSKIINAGEITNDVARGLKTVYQSQLGSYSEALFEGLEGKESLEKQLSDDFEAINGYAPQGEELKKITKSATDAGITRMNINRALLSVTNFSQYNSIFKSFDAARIGAEAAAEKYGSKVILDKTGKAIVSGKTQLPKWFDSGFGKYLKPLATAATSMRSGDVVKESLQEGLEEGLQFLTDKSLNNYYTWKHYGENKNIGKALQEGLDEIFTKEGLESIFTGMLAGGGQTAVTNFLTNLNPQYKQSKKDYETQQALYAQTYTELDEKVKNLPDAYKKIPNSIKQKVNNVINNNSVGGTLGDKVQQANASAALLEIKNNPSDEEQYNQALTHELFTLALPYAKNGNVDILLEQYENYRKGDVDSFQKLWKVSAEEAKNKDKILDYHIAEFKKVQEAFKRVDNAFQRPGNSKISNNVYNTLKTELAFSFYNNNRLTETATELEQGIGKDYVDMLSGIMKDSKKNKTEIERINALGDIATKEEKNKAKGLEKMNEFLANMSESTTATDTKKAIYENLVKPYQEEKGLADNYDLEEKLNKIYYLNKVKDRVIDNQEKINAILYSNNPGEYIQKKEADYQLEQKKLTDAKARKAQEETLKKINELAIEEAKKEAEKKAAEAKKPKQKTPPALRPDEDQDAAFIEAARIKKKAADAERIKKEEENKKLVVDEDLEGDVNDIESKDQELLYIIDEDGNIAEIDSDEAKIRAKRLIRVVNGRESMQDFKASLTLESTNVNAPSDYNAISFAVEGHLLYKKNPTEGVNVKGKDGKSLGVIPYERELYVNAVAFTRITGINVAGKTKFLNVKTLGKINEGVSVITYSDFLSILKQNEVANKAVRKENFILNRKDKKGNVRKSAPLSELEKNHLLYINFSNYLKANEKNLNDENVKEEILNQLDILAFFDEKKRITKGDNIKIPLSAMMSPEDLQKQPIIEVTRTKTGYNYQIINGGLFESDPKIIKFKEQFPSYNGNGFLEVEQSKIYSFLMTHSNTYNSAEDGMQILSAQQRPLKDYEQRLDQTFNTGEKLVEYLNDNAAGVVTSSKDNKVSKVKIELSSDKQSLQINVNFEENQVVGEKYSYFIKLAELKDKNLEEIIDIIEAKLITEKTKKDKETVENPVTGFKVFKSNKNLQGKYNDFEAILVNNYFAKNNFQAYSSLYLKIIPNGFKEGEVVPTLNSTVDSAGQSPVSTVVVDDIEAKKAEIERRIQEIENFVNQDFFAESELLAKHWKTKKDLFENKVKQLKDLLQKGIKTGKDLRTLTNLLNDIRGVLNEGLNINNNNNVELNEKNIQELADSLFSMISDDVIKDYINEMNNVMESRFGKDAVSQQLIQYTTGEWTLDGKNVEYFLSKETLENAKNNKQINAKYNAELKVLTNEQSIIPVINKNLPLGKVPGLPYEIKTDGVYLFDVTGYEELLENKNGLSYTDLISDDIENRREWALKMSIYDSSLVINNVNNININRSNIELMYFEGYVGNNLVLKARFDKDGNILNPSNKKNGLNELQKGIKFWLSGESNTTQFSELALNMKSDLNITLKATIINELSLQELQEEIEDKYDEQQDILNNGIKPVVTVVPVVDDNFDYVTYNFNILIKQVPDDGNWGNFFPKNAAELISAAYGSFISKNKELTDAIFLYLRDGKKEKIDAAPIVTIVLTPKEQYINKVQKDLKAVGFEFIPEILEKYQQVELDKLQNRIEKTLYSNGVIPFNVNNVNVDYSQVLNLVRIIPITEVIITPVNNNPASTRIENNNKQLAKDLINNCKTI